MKTPTNKCCWNLTSVGHIWWFYRPLADDPCSRLGIFVVFFFNIITAYEDLNQTSYSEKRQCQNDLEGSAFILLQWFLYLFYPISNKTMQSFFFLTVCPRKTQPAIWKSKGVLTDLDNVASNNDSGALGWTLSQAMLLFLVGLPG